MKKLILATIAILVLVASSASAVELKGGYFFNFVDGERKPVVATNLKTWENLKIKNYSLMGGLALDFWATDLDQLTKGLQEDWTGGLSIGYVLPIDLLEKKVNLTIGYGVGAKSPLSQEKAELVHGAVGFAINYKF